MKIRMSEILRLSGWVVGLASLLLPTSSAARAPASLPSLFPMEASIEVDGAGLARWTLPQVVLETCAPDLRDLRLLDASGRELPYLLEDGRDRSRDLVREERIALAVVAADRRQTRSETAPPRWSERYEVALPTPAAQGTGWALELQVGGRRFVRRVEVRGDAGEVLASGSVFRLESGARREFVELAPLDSKRLVVEIEGEGAGYLTPRFRLRRGRRWEGRELELVELPVQAQTRAATQTRIELRRPAGMVLDSIVVESSSGLFDREVRVRELQRRAGRPQSGAEVGRGRVVRVAGVEWLEVGIDRPLGSEGLEILIEDGDSPPLDDLRFAARGLRPGVVFALPPGERRARVLFGGGRARRPRYDLESLRTLVPAHGRLRGELAEGFRSPLAGVTFGGHRPNPEFDARPALAFAMFPGAALESSGWSHRAAFTAAPSAEGLSEVELPSALLSVARGDLADLRVVDPQGRQWPYLIEASGGVGRERLPVVRSERRGEETHYELALPSQPFELMGIEVDPDRPFFDRAFRLESKQGLVASGRFRRSENARGAVTRRFEATRVEHLELILVDGGDASLPLAEARALVRRPRLFVTAPAGAYWILSGAPEAQAPTYELESVREVVLAVESGLGGLGPVVANHEFRAWRRWTTGELGSRVLLWGALLSAVVLLGGLTIRLARQPGEPQ